jgi:hypothetical protein
MAGNPSCVLSKGFQTRRTNRMSSLFPRVWGGIVPEDKRLLDMLRDLQTPDIRPGRSGQANMAAHCTAYFESPILCKISTTVVSYLLDVQ